MWSLHGELVLHVLVGRRQVKAGEVPELVTIIIIITTMINVVVVVVEVVVEVVVVVVV